MFKKISLLIFIVAMVPSCGEEAIRNTIPYARVNFTIDLNGMDHELRNPLSYRIYGSDDRRVESDRMGYAGLLVVTGADGTIYAYDSCCPHEDNKQVTVLPKQDGTAGCSHCESQYVTIYGLGSPVSGPSSESLQIYRVIPLKDGTFQIIN